MNFFESRVTEYQKAPILAPCSDDELVSDIFNLKETKRLTDQSKRNNRLCLLHF